MIRTDGKACRLLFKKLCQTSHSGQKAHKTVKYAVLVQLS